jgi:hypothetical protein
LDGNFSKRFIPRVQSELTQFPWEVKGNLIGSHLANAATIDLGRGNVFAGESIRDLFKLSIVGRTKF